MNTVNFQKSYYCNFVEGKFIEEENGSCLTLEYLINDSLVRFIIKEMFLDKMNRQTRTTMLRQVKDELGDWVTVGHAIEMKMNDNWFIDTSNGQSVPSSEAFENVDDLDQPIEGTDPLEYVQKQQLKAGLINEVDYMISANDQLFQIMESQSKSKIASLY